MVSRSAPAIGVDLGALDVPDHSTPSELLNWNVSDPGVMARRVGTAKLNGFARVMVGSELQR